ncbi:retrovirus-related pol polyprotein from transposon TNT 1-94 [Tanacetum coccineum]
MHRYAVSSLMDTAYWFSESLIFKISSFKLQNVRLLLIFTNDPYHQIPVAKTFHEHTNEELTKKEIKQMEADDQAIQTILMGSDIGGQEKKAKLFNEWERFPSIDRESIKSYYHHFLKLMNDFKRNKHFPEKIASNLKFLNNLQPEWKHHIIIVRQIKDLHQVHYNELYDFLKMNQEEVNELKAERLAKTHDPLALMTNYQNPYNYPVFHLDHPSQITYMKHPPPKNNYVPQPLFNTNYMQQPMPNSEDISNLTIAMNMALVLMAKAFKLNYSTPTKNNQRISSNHRNRQIAQSSMNMGQDRQMQMVGGNGGNQFRQYDGQNAGNQIGYITGNHNGYNAIQNVGNQVRQNVVQNLGIHNVGNQNGLIVVPRITKGMRIRMEMELHSDTNEIEEVNANCILMANLQQASTSGTQTNKAPVYDSDGSAKEIANLNNQLSKEKSTVSYLQEERKKLKDDFKTREDEFLDKLIQAEKKIKELDNILVKTGQSIQTMHMLSPKPNSFYHTEHKMALGYQNPIYLKHAQKKKQSLYNGKVLLDKHDPPSVYDSKQTLQLAQESRLQMKQLNKEIKPENYAKINKLSEIFVSQKAKSQANGSLDKNKVLEHENERLLRAVVTQDLMSIVQNNSVVDTSNFQTEHERTKEKLEICVIKKEKEYDVLWNNCNTKNDRVPSASKSSCIKNKEVEVEEHPRNLLLSKNQTHMSSECNNIKLAIQNDKSKVICAMCKQYLITANHDVCVLNYVNDMNSRADNQNVRKFMGTVRFGNDHVYAILGYGDLQWGNILIAWVYFIEGLGHNLFSIGQFCDSDLKVSFRRNTCFVKNLEEVDLLKGNHTTNLYTINLHQMASASHICLIARAISTKSWLWHQRLSHLNFDTINELAKNDLVTGLLKFRYSKEHLFPSCEQGKSKTSPHKPKPTSNSKQGLHLLHMDFYGLMRVKSINGKRYVLVIVDDYSCYTWVYFLRSKDEAP